MPTPTNSLPPLLFPPAAYFAALARGAEIDFSARYDKRLKAVHRYEIVDARGRMMLTVPLAKPHGVDSPTWADCPLSTHDEWWRKHLTALESAYGRTPFFEFLIDRFEPVFRSPHDWSQWPSAIDLVRAANSIVLPLLAIPEASAQAASEPPALGPYWQVRQHLFGFVESLSVLDLIFNLGPEAALYIRR